MLAELHKMCGAAQPTAFHKFLKRLDDDGKLSRVYTSVLIILVNDPATQSLTYLLPLSHTDKT
jgi:hypothetical protein